MAKYKASPYYMVGDIQFDMHGEYATEKAEEIAALDELVPTWVRKVDEPKKVAEEPKEPDEPKAAPKPRKASGK